jgi:hypothetical protein
MGTNRELSAEACWLVMVVLDVPIVSEAFWSLTVRDDERGDVTK